MLLFSHFHVRCVRLTIFAIVLGVCGLYGADNVHAVKYYYVHPGLTTGLGDGTSWTNAWKSLMSVNWAQLGIDADTQPVYLYIKKGTVSPDRISPGAGNGGSSDVNRVIVTTDPADTGDNPIITASKRITGPWANVSGEVYSAPTGLTYDSWSGWQDGTIQLFKRTTDANVERGEYYIDKTVSPYTVYVRMTDGAHPSTHTLDLNNTRTNVYLYQTDFFTIENVNLWYGGEWGVARAYQSGNVTMRNITVRNCVQGLIGMTTANSVFDNIDVEGCWNKKTYTSGLGAGAAFTAYDWPDRTGPITIKNSRFVSNYLGVSSTSEDQFIVQNTLVAKNMVNGMDLNSASATPADIRNVTIIHQPSISVIPDNGHGLVVRGGTLNRGLRTRNVVIYHDGYPDTETVQIDSTAFRYIDLDYNLYYMMGTSRNHLQLQNLNYFTIPTWSAALQASGYAGTDSHSQISDPQFNNAQSDFTLSWNSPAIDAGTDVGLTADIHNNPIYGNPDIGAYEYQPPYTMGQDTIDHNANIRLYGDGKYRNLSQSQGTPIALTITPTSNDTKQFMDISIITWDTAHAYKKTWTEQSATITGNVNHTVGNLTPHTPYTVRVDGTIQPVITGPSCTNSVCTSDSTGTITFTYTGTYSTHEFNIQDESIQSYTPTPTTNTATQTLTTTIQSNISLDCTHTGHTNKKTIEFGSLTPGNPITQSTTCTVATNSTNGYTLTTQRDHTTATMNKDATHSIPDRTPWNPQNPNATKWQTNDTGLAFTIISSTANKNTTWWGTGTHQDDPNNNYTGFPQTAQSIMTTPAYSTIPTETIIGYKLDIPTTQQAGIYQGAVTYQVTVNP